MLKCAGYVVEILNFAVTTVCLAITNHNALVRVIDHC